MIKEIIEYIKKHPKVRTAFQVDDRIVVDVEEEDAEYEEETCECNKCGSVWNPFNDEHFNFTYCYSCGSDDIGGSFGN